jgi:hypothetical protein
MRTDQSANTLSVTLLTAVVIALLVSMFAMLFMAIG